MTSCPFLTLALLLATATATLAGPAADVIRPFYGKQLGMETDKAWRGLYTDPARRQLDLNDKVNNTGDMGCIDFGLALDAQDYDDDEIRRSIKFDEKVTGDTAVVVASFTNFRKATRIEWTLRQVGGRWKISDIASPDNDWRLSKFECAP